MSKGIMNIKEVAEYLSFSQKKIYNLVKGEEIPFAKIGGQYRFVKEEIDSWLKSLTKKSKYYGKKLKLEPKRSIRKSLKRKKIQKSDLKWRKCGGKSGWNTEN